MATKKGQPIQLQAEINTDEEWEKLLTREGLIVVDVYSDWCGPCQAMSPNLKKLKLEIGGDMLHLAMAKSDTIQQLERFRNKSEPTWMFISKGKMVNLMFGADAPKLSKLIVDELKKETAVQGGTQERTSGLEITELAEEEQVRYQKIEAIERIARDKEEAKKAKELKERRTAEAESILANLEHLNVVLIFPHAKENYKEVLNELVEEAGLAISQVDKVNLTEAMMEEILYFCGEEEFTAQSTEELLNEESLAILIKPARGEVIEDIDEAVLRVVYGVSKTPPGDEDSPAKYLFELFEDEEGVKLLKTAIWTPTVKYVRAVLLKLFFPKVAATFTIPEPEPEPQHVAVVFDASKREDALGIMEQFPKEIMRYGFFTSEVPVEANLIAKSVKKLEKLPVRDFEEKLVIQVTRRKSECVFLFAQLGPLYMSPNYEEGKKECLMFFGEDYDEPPEEEEVVEEVVVVKEKIASLQAEVPAEEEKRLTGTSGQEEVEEGSDKKSEGSEVSKEPSEVLEDNELLDLVNLQQTAEPLFADTETIMPDE